MKAKINKLPDSKTKILFEVPWQELLPYLDKAALKLSENLNIPGFRTGKIPREIVEKEVGQQRVLTQGVEFLVGEKYQQYVTENKIEPIGSPKIEILKLAPNNPLSFKVVTEVLPEIELPDYKRIASEIKKQEVSVTDKEVEQALNWLQKSKAEFRKLKREAKIGDFLEIEYKSPQIENNKTFEDSFFLGKGQFVPGFEENLKGMKKEEEKEFAVTFPEEYKTNKDLAGKKVIFKVKVEKVQEAKLPELNDEFAKKLGNFENLSQLFQNIKQGIEKEKQNTEIQKRRGEILDKIAEKTKVDIPQTLVDFEKQQMTQEIKERVKNDLKIPFEKYLEKIKKSEQELKDSFSETAKNKVRNFLILRNIGKKENIEVKQEEIESGANGFLKNFPEPEKAKQLDINRLKEYYKGVIYNEKVFQILDNQKYESNNSNNN